MPSSSNSKPALSATALLNIPVHHQAQMYQHGTPAQDARYRKHQKNKDRRRLDLAYRLASDESLSLEVVESNAVFRYLLHLYPDQFQEVNGVCVRRTRHVPMNQENPTMTLRPLLPVGLRFSNLRTSTGLTFFRHRMHPPGLSIPPMTPILRFLLRPPFSQLLFLGGG